MDPLRRREALADPATTAESIEKRDKNANLEVTSASMIEEDASEILANNNMIEEANLMAEVDAFTEQESTEEGTKPKKGQLQQRGGEVTRCVEEVKKAGCDDAGADMIKEVKLLDANGFENEYENKLAMCVK